MEIFRLLGNTFEYRGGNLTAWCSPTGESRITAMVSAGVLTGANPMNEATYLVLEYAPVAGSTFCAVPVLPATV